MRQMLMILAAVTAGALFAAAPTGAKHQLSTHILDVSRGAPASGVTIVLYRMTEDGGWTKVAEGVTDQNGRIGNFLPETQPNDGIYKLRFETRGYFKAQGLDSIYPFVEVVFEIKGSSHYHIPITLSANGYGTYRGNRGPPINTHVSR